MVDIVPTINYVSFEDVRQAFLAWEPLVRRVHIDMADGRFVPSKLPGPLQIASIETPLRYECHLMVVRPDQFVDDLIGNPQVDTVIIHAESQTDLGKNVERIKSSGKRVGIALRPESAIEQLAGWLGQADQLLLLGVEPGFNGSPFIPETVERVRQLRQRWPDGIIEVDGGMNLATAPEVVRAGASRLAVGSYLHEDTWERLAQLKKAVYGI